jgi:hypothetical protein
LTRLDEITDRATARASASSRAPVTAAVISVLAPSPSAACWRAGSRAIASIARPKRSLGAVSAGRPHATPDENETVSFALLSPSTESWFRSALPRVGGGPEDLGATFASVRITDNIVAICGWIIPTPLATR